ncbi:MAG: hypothetical protein WBC61_00390, partial [Dehalococcoidia bacterium]
FRASSSGIVLHLTKTTVTVWETTISNTGAGKIEARLRSKTRVKNRSERLSADLWQADYLNISITTFRR